jgi:hypothetical protein
MVEVYTPTSRTGNFAGADEAGPQPSGLAGPGFGKCLLVKAGEYEEPPDGERRHAAGEWVLRTAWAVQMQQTRE